MAMTFDHVGAGVDRCRRCACTASPDQLQLFDADEVGGLPISVIDWAMVSRDQASQWTPIETSASGRIGFWRERAPQIFGYRTGVGPLIISPDTNILISLREELDEVDSSASVILGARWSDRGRLVDSLRDLIQLWFWRDVRFWVSDLHVEDAPQAALSPERRQAREAAVGELQQDFFERGGFEVILSDQIDLEDEPCAIHAIPAPPSRSGRPTPRERRWPRGERDRGLLEAAFEAGCQIFLTTDKDILKCHDSFATDGLAILSPTALMERLDEAGELHDTAGPGNAPFPDVSVLARLYGGFGI